MISVRNLTKRFEDLRRGWFTALEDVSFSVGAGEVFGLLGPNGAGKTTCLRILSTVLQPTSGEATVAGACVFRRPEEVRRRIGFVSGNTGVYDRMTAREFVEYFGRLHGLDERALRSRIDELFTTLQMHEFRDSLCGRLSTGMKQKVSIARAVIHDPPVLVFDEPTSGLDLVTARALLAQIAALRRDGKCIIFSTHIMDEVERLCDRIAVIVHGRIVAQGTRTELVEQHAANSVHDLLLELMSRPAEGATGDAVAESVGETAAS